MTDPYPLTFEPILKEKVWGGRRLERLGKPLEPGKRYGESWEIADLDATSTSGGGGGGAHSVIDRGPMAGHTIRDAIRLWNIDLLGPAGMAAARRLPGDEADPAFPLLIKYLDAREHLSVQTHPSPAYAAAHPGAHLKTESWYVLDAERTTRPDGLAVDPCLFIGTRAGVTRDRFRDSIERGAITDVLLSHAALPGDCWTLPSGVVHALGAGVMVAEVQTPSDTTFRVHDWQTEYQRPDRAMHVEEALECMDFERGSDAPPRARGPGTVASTPFYIMEHAEPGAGRTLPPEECAIIMVAGGEGELVSRGDGFEAVRLPTGRTTLVPAVCAESAMLRGGEDFAVLLIRVGPG